MDKNTQAKIIARAWKDEAFKKKLLNSPDEVMKEYGIKLSNDQHFSVLQETNTQFYFVLPMSPANANKLNEAELENIAAARALGCHPPINTL